MLLSLYTFFCNYASLICNFSLCRAQRYFQFSPNPALGPVYLCIFCIPLHKIYNRPGEFHGIFFICHIIHKPAAPDGYLRGCFPVLPEIYDTKERKIECPQRPLPYEHSIWCGQQDSICILSRWDKIKVRLRQAVGGNAHPRCI